MPSSLPPRVAGTGPQALLVVALAAAVLGGIVGCVTAPASPSPADGVTPVGSPTAAPGAGAGETPSNVVPLSGVAGYSVAVDIIDGSGLLMSAESGTPGDGASVAPYEVLVTNDDPTTVRLVWAGGPCDAVDQLTIDAAARVFLLVEPECPGDAVAFDRVLILHFMDPVPADDVRAVLQDGTDTAG
jgi:hypothetical protein